MILEDDELEQAQMIRETFRKNPSYTSSWRGAQEGFTENARMFGSSKLGMTDVFPRAFQSYGAKVRNSAASAAALSPSKATSEPPGTLIASVRKTFYNSEKGHMTEVKQPPSPPYSVDTK